MRILIDVTALYFHGNCSGIPRLVQKLTDHLAGMPDVEVVWFVHAWRGFYRVPVREPDRPPRLSRSKAWLRAAALRLPCPLPANLRALASAFWRQTCDIRLAHGAYCGQTPRLTQFGPRDVVLLLGAPGYSSFFAAMQRYRGGALVLAFVCDLFPLRYPHLYREKDHAAFRKEFPCRVRIADGVVCSSEETTKSVRQFLVQQNLSKAVTRVYLGADFETSGMDRAPLPSRAHSVFRPGTVTPVMLSVGSIERRKNYGFALALCTRLWAQGHNFTYAIAGAPGWMSREFMSAMRRHPEWGERLIYLGALGDRELLRAYKSSQFFLNTSIDEGFGIPVMEALHHNLSVICSDIPIFHELCTHHAHYIPLDDIATAAEQTGAPLRQARDVASAPGWHEARQPPGMTSWRECADALVQEISRHRERRLHPAREMVAGTRIPKVGGLTLPA
jgi:glycosyltransferase involved in cell wall biosynthesis